MDYKTYMLRIWKGDNSKKAPKVRFSIENVRTGTRIGFTELKSLITYLDVDKEDSEITEQL